MDDGTSSITFPESADSSPYILAHVGSYVPAGYIMLDHSPVNESSPYSKSVSSIWPKPPPRVIQSWNYLFWKTLRSAFFVQRSPRFGSNLFCLAFGEKKFSVCSLYMRRTFEMLPRGISSEPLKPSCTDIKYDNTQKLSLKPRQSGFRLRILLKNTSPLVSLRIWMFVLRRRGKRRIIFLSGLAALKKFKVFLLIPFDFSK